MPQNRYGLPSQNGGNKNRALQVIENAGLTQEDGSNAAEIGTALTDAALRSMSGATNPEEIRILRTMEPCPLA